MDNNNEISTKEAPTNDKSDMKRKRNLDDINAEIAELNEREELIQKRIKYENRSSDAEMALKKRGVDIYVKRREDKEMETFRKETEELEASVDYDSMTTDELLELSTCGVNVVLEGIKSYYNLLSKIKAGTYKKEQNTAESSK